MKKIKILKNDNLGDTLLAIPFFKYIEKFLPTQEIIIYFKKEDFLFLKEFFEIKSQIKIFPTNKELWKFKKEFFDERSIILDLVGNFFNLFLVTLSKNISFGLNRYNFSEHYTFTYFPSPNHHETLNYLNFLQFFLEKNGIILNTTLYQQLLNLISPSFKKNFQKEVEKLFLISSDKLKEKLTEEFDIKVKYFIYHIGGHPAKRLKLHSEEKLISLLAQKEYLPVLVGTKAEEEHSRIVLSLFNKYGKAPLVLTGKTDSLSKLASLFKKAQFFIGPDSGPAHLAGILGIKTIVYFGPTSSERFSPLGKNVHVFTTTRSCAPCWFPENELFCEKLLCLDGENFKSLFKFLEKI